MQSPAARALLERCCTVVANIDMDAELRARAWSIFDRLIEMHDEDRMRASVLVAALDSLGSVPGLEDCVTELRATVARHEAGPPTD
jgi:hypothetical protein